MRFAPKRLAKLAIKQVGANECIVYGGSKGIIPILNDTARLVLTMCNGVRTVQEIAREVETSYETHELSCGGPRCNHNHRGIFAPGIVGGDL